MPDRCPSYCPYLVFEKMESSREEQIGEVRELLVEVLETILRKVQESEGVWRRVEKLVLEELQWAFEEASRVNGIDPEDDKDGLRDFLIEHDQDLIHSVIGKLKTAMLKRDPSLDPNDDEMGLKAHMYQKGVEDARAGKPKNSESPFYLKGYDATIDDEKDRLLREMQSVPAVELKEEPKPEEPKVPGLDAFKYWLGEGAALAGKEKESDDPMYLKGYADRAREKKGE